LYVRGEIAQECAYRCAYAHVDSKNGHLTKNTTVVSRIESRFGYISASCYTQLSEKQVTYTQTYCRTWIYSRSSITMFRPTWPAAYSRTIINILHGY